MDAKTQQIAFLSAGLAALGLGIFTSGYLSSEKTETVKTDKAGVKKAVTKVLCISLGGTGFQFAIVEKSRSSSGELKIDIKRRGVDVTGTTEHFAQAIGTFLGNEAVDEVGIASFGPVGLVKGSEHFGYITSTPKAGWQYFPLLKEISKVAKQPLAALDTDVNAAAVAEFAYGKHNVVESLAYITVGTGIGVGIVAGGKPVHGLTHPEGGHILVKIDPADADFPGVCPFHKNCIEGLCSNQSVAKRLDISVFDLPKVAEDHDVWRRLAYYLAQLCLNITLLVSPECIVIGGGVVKQKTIIPNVKKNFTELLANYVQHPRLKDVDSYIKTPTLGDDVEIIGAALLSE